jgi:hypothetical protein
MSYDTSHKSLFDLGSEELFDGSGAPLVTIYLYDRCFRVKNCTHSSMSMRQSPRVQEKNLSLAHRDRPFVLPKPISCNRDTRVVACSPVMAEEKGLYR